MSQRPWHRPVPVETLPTPLGPVRSLLLLGALLGLVSGIAIWRRVRNETR